MLDVEIVHEEQGLADLEDQIIRIVRTAFEQISDRPSGDWSMSILVSGSDEISRLHAEYFNDPSDTDVMSFPSGDDLGGIGGYLGDVAISLPVARRQARDHGHAVQCEVAYLSLHGLLHLLGWEDNDAEKRRCMLNRQDDLFTDAVRDLRGNL